MDRKNSILIFGLALFALAGTLAAACGSPKTGSGKCVGNSVNVDCEQITDPACCSSMMCSWGNNKCNQVAGAGGGWDCVNFDNNEAFCKIAGAGPSGDCIWIPTAVTPGSGKIPYDLACHSNGGCAGGLVCNTVSGKCTQPADTCSYAPEVYVYTPPESNGQLPAKSVVLNITGLEQGTGLVKSSNGNGIYRVGWFSDWKIAGLTGVAIAIFIIAVAAMAGHAFNLPEAKAFAHAEFSQALVSVLIIIFMLGFVGFLDVFSQMMVASAGLPVPCDANIEPCYISAAKYYLQTLYDTANGHARNTLEEEIRTYRASSTGYSLQLNFWWLLFSGTSIRPNAGLSINAERKSAIFDTVSKLMGSISAQQYFIDVVSFGIAPIFLLLGIVLRTFFFTRKLGGLLLAIALSLFIVYPLSYAFAWFTLNVTVYGERAFGPGADASCPQECSYTYPTAFYTNSTGRIVQFRTTQDLLIAGITPANWAAGGPKDKDGNPRFPGLVACRDLTNTFKKIIGQGGSIPPDSCSGCPDFCREVPFRAELPGCNIAACGNCNAGCKIMRLREDCNEKCTGCDTTDCRTKLPVEDKCYQLYNESAPFPVVSANLSVSCGGCNGCPNWCRMLINSSDGKLSLKYSDAACQVAACSLAQCPQDCMYITRLPASTKCDDSCKTCPIVCRITNLDEIANYNPTNVDCSMSDCKACPASCKITVPIQMAAQQEKECAPYPEINHVSENCGDCPAFCRFDSYSFITGSGLSKTEMDATKTLPFLCVSGKEGRLNCGTAGNPPACDASCMAVSKPPLCRNYSASAPALSPYCEKCPVEARMRMDYTINTLGPGQIPCTATPCPSGLTCVSGGVCKYTCSGTSPCPPGYGCNAGICDFIPSTTKKMVLPALGTGYASSCAATSCADACQATLPAMVDGVNCKDYNPGGATSECELCPLECRVNMKNPSILDSSKCGIAACSDPACPDSCKVSLGSHDGQVCEAYYGGGSRLEYKCERKSMSGMCNGVCKSNSLGNDCDTSSGVMLTYACCRWVPDYRCFGGTACNSYNDQAACNAGGCRWLQLGSSQIPIDERSTPNDKRDGCRQCPENCRLKDSAGIASEECGTGVETDCSSANCPLGCRALAADKSALCGDVEPEFGKSCAACPLLCRSENPPASGFCPGQCQPYNPLLGTGCKESCYIGTPPKKICSGCMDCPFDCLFYPSVRTDCGDVCSEDALAGPLNVGPDDFVKKLPGAASSQTDVLNTGLLMLPALIMPLFCIVMVVAFIRVFSPLLGGDIEIPGLSRLI